MLSADNGIIVGMRIPGHHGPTALARADVPFQVINIALFAPDTHTAYCASFLPPSPTLTAQTGEYLLWVGVS